MPTIDRDGVTIYYEDRGSGPAILFSHGYSATSRMWAGDAEALSGTHRAITWDMRGHGESDSPADPAQYSEAHTVEDMAAILRHCGVDRAVIGGHSMGGYMSLAFNLAHPEMVRALLLMDTGPGYRNPRGREGWNETAFKRAQRLEERGLEALGSGAEVALSRHRSAAGLANAARGMLAQFDSRVIESLEQITVPTLVLVGENDTPFLAGTDYMAGKIPGAKKVVIAGAGHAPNLEQPETFRAAIREFLASLP